MILEVPILHQSGLLVFQSSTNAMGVFAVLIFGSNLHDFFTILPNKRNQLIFTFFGIQFEKPNLNQSQKNQSGWQDPHKDSKNNL